MTNGGDVAVLHMERNSDIASSMNAGVDVLLNDRPILHNNGSIANDNDIFGVRVPPSLWNYVSLDKNVLGRGAHSVVVSGTEKKTGRQVAVKLVPKRYARSSACAEHEAMLLSKLAHPSLVKLVHFVSSDKDDTIALVLEMGGAVLPCLQKEKNTLVLPQPEFHGQLPSSPPSAPLPRASMSLGTLTKRTSHLGNAGKLALENFDALDDEPCEKMDCEPLDLSMRSSSSRDLFEWLERVGPFSESDAKIVFGQLVSVIGYLHRNGVCHGDLKDENVLLDACLGIKLIDLGTSAEGDPNGPVWAHGARGTGVYNSPESIISSQHSCPNQPSSPNSLSSSNFFSKESGQPSPEEEEEESVPLPPKKIAKPCRYCYDARASDMWALGVLLYTMVIGEPPFSSIQEVLWRHAAPYSRPLSESIKLLISRLLLKDPKKRWTLEDVEKCSFLKN